MMFKGENICMFLGGKKIKAADGGVATPGPFRRGVRSHAPIQCLRRAIHSTRKYINDIL